MFQLISKKELIDLTSRQIKNLFTLDRKKELKLLKNGIIRALERCEYCFSSCKNKYYFKGGNIVFNPFHSGQYSIFLYYLSNVLYKESKNSVLADKVYYLNKVMNSVDIYYEVELPDIFDLDHPMGSVMGRARYSNYFYFTQHCTIGNNKGIYPVIGENVIMYAGASIIGDSQIGDNCSISARTFIKDQEVPDNSIAFGISPNLKIVTKDELYFRRDNKKWKF